MDLYLNHGGNVQESRREKVEIPIKCGRLEIRIAENNNPVSFGISSLQRPITGMNAVRSNLC
jgi:hypothetical protein